MENKSVMPIRPMEREEFRRWLAQMNVSEEAVAAAFGRSTIEEQVQELEEAVGSRPDFLSCILWNFVLKGQVTSSSSSSSGGWSWDSTTRQPVARCEE